MSAGARVLACMLFALACATPAPQPARAESDPTQRVHFQVERSREVANDWATAVAGVSDEDTDAARLADRVNRTMRWALDLAKDAPGIEVKSGGYHTHPVHGKSGRIERWRASQDLILESADVEALSALLGELQARLLLRSIGFSVSPATRREAEDALIAETLAAFEQRAQLVRSELDARDYELVSLSIQNPGGGHPVHNRGRMMIAAEMAPAPPALESGQSTLVVRVDATIELER